MTPARRNKLEQALAVIADVNDADAWGTLTAETRATLAGWGAEFMNTDKGGFIRFEGVSAACDFDRGEHLLLRWAANARTELAQGADEEIPFVSTFTEIEAGGCAPPIIVTSGYAEMRDLPTEEQE